MNIKNGTPLIVDFSPSMFALIPKGSHPMLVYYYEAGKTLMLLSPQPLFWRVSNHPWVSARVRDIIRKNSPPNFSWDWWGVYVTPRDFAIHALACTSFSL